MQQGNGGSDPFLLLKPVILEQLIRGQVKVSRSYEEKREKLKAF